MRAAAFVLEMTVHTATDKSAALKANDLTSRTRIQLVWLVSSCTCVSCPNDLPRRVLVKLQNGNVAVSDVMRALHIHPDRTQPAAQQRIFYFGSTM